MGWGMTLPGMVGDFDDHEMSSLQNFRSLGAVEAYSSHNGVGRELGTFCAKISNSMKFRVLKRSKETIESTISI